MFFRIMEAEGSGEVHREIMMHDKHRYLKTVVIFLGLLCFASGTTVSIAQTTKIDHVVCSKKKWMLEMLDFMYYKKRAKFKNYLDNKRCFLMEEEKKIRIEVYPGMFGKVVKFRYKGRSYWTDKDGIDYKKR